jgi:hypothetical protein
MAMIINYDPWVVIYDHKAWLVFDVFLIKFYDRYFWSETVQATFSFQKWAILSIY